MMTAAAFNPLRRTLPLTLLVFCALLASSVRAAETYKIDPVHSFVIFKIKHLNVAYAYGRFTDLSGQIVYDESKLENGSLAVEVKAESVDTGNAKRDEHLKGPDFFNVKQFPLITFKGTKVVKTGADTYDLTGDLTLHGVTKPVTAKVVSTGEGKGMKGELHRGAEATFSIKRSDFGMKYGLEGVSDDVSLIVSIDGVRE